jgi:formamidopyrimidine-DNA glycosylase
MPELPEVESVCVTMRKALVGHPLCTVEAGADSIVFKNDSVDEIKSVLKGQYVSEVGRKGKYFWWVLSPQLSLIGHLGMSGWVENVGKDALPPRFCKLLVRRDDGEGIAITDARRLGRIWLTEDPQKDPTIRKLGLDAYRELPKNPKFREMLTSLKAPIKAVLLDQGFLSGIGNYLADEILYHARISPHRKASELGATECAKLRSTIEKIIKTAVEAGADETRFPTTWLFHHRWGGKRGADKIGVHAIVRETVAGRTTAWVPEVQK